MSTPLRWTIGAATITAVIESTTPTSPRFLYDGVTKADVIAQAGRSPWLHPHFVDDDGFLRQVVQCLVIEADDLVVAVDTCIGNDKERHNEHWHHLDGPFLHDLTDAGFSPESVTHVVCTHLHVDHVGWNTRLVDGVWVPTFPNARYLFVAAEYDHWQTEESLFPGDRVFDDSVAPIAAAGLADRVAPDHRLSPSIAMVPTPGHTPGHVSVEVRSGEQRAVITGDMAHHPLQLIDPDLSSRFDTDAEAARATRRTAFADWSDGRTLVVGTHFGPPTAGILVNDDNSGGYRLDLAAVTNRDG